MSTQKKLIKILKNHQPDIDETNLSMDTPISELGIDSLDFIEVVFEIETIFGIEIPDEKLSDLRNIEDFLQCIETKEKETCHEIT